ncbi:MAG: class I tRNA ligase family protein, partial [Bacteroidia bacterium]|nr:class I tRNA ligase family protein [Bacteroidia bacterium]
MANKVFITSALPYCNNVPHLGNIIGSTLSGDVYARYRKMKGDDVLYLCGTDVYGTTTEVKALQEKMSCEEICEKYTLLHKNVYDWFNINFDVWGQTNTVEQTQITHEIFLNLYNNGFIEEKSLMQMYCPTCNKFLADRYLKGICYHPECNGKNNITNGDQCDSCQKFIDADKIIKPFCCICKTTPFLKESNHLYLKLGELADEIRKYNFENPNVQLSDFVNAITKSWLDGGLESRCITRDLTWGTPVPWEYDETLSKYKGKVFYVWFDAPFGYYSILMKNRPDWKNWLNKVEMIQKMGKDNVSFHTVMFPGSILGSKMNLPLVNKLSCTEYLLYEGEK